MPAVIVVAHRPAEGEDHPRVTIAGLNGTVTLDITSPESEFANLADDLAAAARPFDRPILTRGAPRLATMTLEATIGSELRRGERDIEPDLLALVAMARGFGRTPHAVRIAYSRLDALLPVTGRWHISDLRIKVRRRAPGSNVATRADVSIELTEESPTPNFATIAPGSPSLAPGPPPPPPGGGSRAPAHPAPTAARQRRHRVRRGETLVKISADHYGGNSSRWREIARANRIRDPRRLRVGQVLVLP